MTVPSQSPVLTLAQYQALVAHLPRPSAQQMHDFAVFIGRAHSWYKHLPLLPPGKRRDLWRRHLADRTLTSPSCHVSARGHFVSTENGNPRQFAVLPVPVESRPRLSEHATG